MIGRTERGFDFLGYHFEPEGLSVAGKTIERFKERIARLYEQGADINRIGQYVLNWLRWVQAEAVLPGYTPPVPPINNQMTI